MRTTVDLPDKLFREAKARAAMEGLSLKDLLIHSVEAHLRGDAVAPAKGKAPARWKEDFEAISERLSQSGEGLSALTLLQADRSRLDRG